MEVASALSAYLASGLGEAGPHSSYLTGPHSILFGCCAFLTSTYFWLGYMAVTREEVKITVSRHSKKIQSIIARCPTLKRAPAPPFFLMNEHLQFFPWSIQGRIHMHMFPVPYQRLEHMYPDGKEKAIIDVYPSFEEDTRPLPIVIILGGLRGHSQDLPGNTLTRRFIATGRFRVVVDHKRGNAWQRDSENSYWGKYIPLMKAEFHLMGCAADVSSSIRYLRQKYPDQANVPTQMVGVSVGSGHLVTCLGGWAKLRKEGKVDRFGFPPPGNMVGGVVAFPGYDIKICGSRVRFPYSLMISETVRSHFIRRNQKVLREGLGDQVVDEALAMKDLQECNDMAYRFTCTESPQDYYNTYNPIHYLPHVDVPILAINPLDDPVTIIENCLEPSPYPEFKGMSYRQFFENSKQPMAIVMPASGSHCPGLDGGNFNFFEKVEGVWMFKNWFDDVTVEFCSAVLDDLDLQNGKRGSRNL